MSKPLSRRKAAAYLGFAPSTLANYAARGIGPAHLRVGGSCRYMKADLDAWLDAHRTGGAK
ncbi:helix-turn-helix transcriptional regulator [Afipia sp. DC4300-2b1]|uniref:helix-turn-helix transcriptional regulator n=1 Tax=Afipia sp. DC4300-2b1 TaxID=2804672 RepID=UPI003CF9F8D4